MHRKGLDVVMASEALTLIVDDTEPVWRDCTANVIVVGGRTCMWGMAAAGRSQCRGWKGAASAGAAAVLAWRGTAELCAGTRAAALVAIVWLRGLVPVDGAHHCTSLTVPGGMPATCTYAQHASCTILHCTRSEPPPPLPATPRCRATTTGTPAPASSGCRSRRSWSGAPTRPPAAGLCHA